MEPDREYRPATPFGPSDAWPLAMFGTQIRMILLPGQLTEALRLVDELTR